MIQKHSFTCLRALDEQDAPWMLEWMRDKDLTEYLYTDFSKKELQDCRRFIRDSRTASGHLHLAVMNKKGLYMGTVSLKHISLKEHTAEFGICMRRIAIGTGLAGTAMKELLFHGYESLDLRAVFWCVSVHNVRANRFYRKHGYKIVSKAPERLTKSYTALSRDELIWYCAERNALR